MSLERLTGARRARALLAVLAAFSALAAHAPSARALVVFDRAVNKSFGIVPAIGQASGMRSSAASGPARSQGMSCATNCTLLSYHSGAVQHGETVYLVFWAPSSYTPAFPAGYVSGMGTWVTDLAGANGTPGNPISVSTQYYDLSGPGGTKSFVPYAITNGGTLLDTKPYPSNGCSVGTTCLTDAQIKAELSSYIQAHSLPTGLNVEYFVMTPQGVHSCFDATGSSCSYSNFCAYHSSLSVSGRQVTYSDLPWSYGVFGCDVNSAFGAGYPNPNFTDPVIGVFSHELVETMTDPVVGSGWVDGSGKEIGDKCAYIYGSHGYGSMTGMNSNGSGYWNVKLGGDLYLLQQEFDNQSGNCASRMTESWSGTTPIGASAAHWSNASNWGASIAPDAGSASNGSVETLLFPALGSAACSGQPPTSTCYSSNNDLTSLSAYGLSIDGGSGYAISGNGLTLGAGGITSTTAATSSKPSSFSPSITLGANQSWAIDGGASKVGQLALGGAVSGPSKSLQISLSNFGSLALGADAEVGAVSIVGTNSSSVGAFAPLNGTVTVGSALNGSDGNTVSLTDAALLVPRTSAVGGLISTGGDIEVGQGTMPAGALTVQGGVTLGSAGRLKLFVDHAGTTAGTHYSQIVAHGNVTLGGSLVLSGGASCPALALGDKYTLISATGSVSGAFFGVPNGQDVQLGCTGTQPRLQINYTANSVTATVMTPSPGGSGTPTRGPPSVSGSAVNVPLSCTGGVGAHCTLTLALTVTETTRDGKVLAVVAAAHRRHKETTKVRVVGRASVTLTAGQSQVLQVVLNTAGQHLLGLRHVLAANLAIVEAGHTISSSNVTFHGHRKWNRRHPRHR